MARKTLPPLPRELPELTAELWLAQGTIAVTDYGCENTYYIDQFGVTMKLYKMFYLSRSGSVLFVRENVTDKERAALLHDSRWITAE